MRMVIYPDRRFVEQKDTGRANGKPLGAADCEHLEISCKGRHEWLNKEAR